MKTSKNDRVNVKNPVLQVILRSVKKDPVMCISLFAAVLGSAVFALLPPLVLAKAIDRLTAGESFSLTLALSYFGLLALTGAAESFRESLLTIFGQKITHSLRKVLCQKVSLLPADAFVSHDSGTIASRFVGDVDTVQELFTSGIISMFADACQLCGIYSPIILTFNAFTVAVVMLLSAFGNGEVQLFFGMTAGTAAAVISYITQVFTLLESIGMEIQTIQSAAAGVHRINEFWKLPEREMAGTMADTNEMSEGSVEPKGEAANTVELKNVTFRYEENDPYILQGLSFSVKEGEQVTLTGRTGAGKSTIFKLLLGIYRPQGGQVFINGQPADSLPDSKRRKIISCVEQNFSMVPGTVRDQITLFDPTITPEQVETAAKLTGLDNVIRSFPNGYDTVCKTGLFSQGQWQLLSIARAVAADPRILLLDEITANLDADTEKTVLSALDRVGNGRTVLSISHRLYESLTAGGKNSSRQIAI